MTDKALSLVRLCSKKKSIDRTLLQLSLIAEFETGQLLLISAPNRSLSMP